MAGEDYKEKLILAVQDISYISTSYIRCSLVRRWKSPSRRRFLSKCRAYSERTVRLFRRRMRIYIMITHIIILWVARATSLLLAAGAIFHPSIFNHGRYHYNLLKYNRPTTKICIV
jgi:hypothetical protein